MKHCFLLNPAAGKGKSYTKLEVQIHNYCLEHRLTYEVYYTSGVGDAEKYVRKVCAEGNSGDRYRFYACGGDGTLCETINGAVGFACAEVAVIPIGTGNDFVRNFTLPDKFMDIGAQVGGSVRRLDLVRYNDRYYANMLNTGFDCEVVRKVAQIKNNPAVPERLAYVFGVLIELIKKPGVKMSVSVDGGEPVEKDLLLTCIGNGSFCGGGFCSEPYASLEDGRLDVCFIKNVSRAKFISMLGSYKKGSYLERGDADSFAEYVRCSRLDISFPFPQSVSIDGEIEQYESISVSVEPGALRFCLPAGCEVTVPPLYGRLAKGATV